MFSLILLAACADYALEADQGGGTKDSAVSGDGSDTSADTGQIDSPANPAWYAVRATVPLVGGAPDPTGASISVEVVDEDLVRIDCDVELDPAEISAAEAPDADVYAWWSLPVTPFEEACTTLPTTLELGLGALDPEVRAQLGSVDLEDEADMLWGAWMRADGGELWAVGYARGTIASDGLPPAPPDDVYTLVPLFLAPLP
jgi:hypothetical protein